MHSPAPIGKKAPSGFTLLEVLVASAVLAVMMTILLSSVSTSLNLWRSTENKISADREGRSGHLLLAQDLANAVVPTNTSGNLTNLWPRVIDGGTNGTVFGFLTLRPPEYQDTLDGDMGDVCYVEYAVRSNALFRRFAGSRETFEALKTTRLPTNTQAQFQLLADNIISNTTALRGTPVQNTSTDFQAIRSNFVLIRFRTNATGGIIYEQAGNNRPDAVEIQFSAADMEAVRNISNLPANSQIRSAGFYTFRINFPR